MNNYNNSNVYQRQVTLYEDSNIILSVGKLKQDQYCYILKQYKVPEDFPKYLIEQIQEKVQESQSLKQFSVQEYTDCFYMKEKNIFGLVYRLKSNWTNIHEMINSKEEKDQFNFTPQQAFYLIISFIEGIFHVLTKTAIHYNISLSNVIIVDDRVLIDYQSSLFEHLFNQYKNEESMKYKTKEEQIFSFMSDFGSNLFEIINYFQFQTEFGKYFEHSDIHQIINQFLNSKKTTTLNDQAKQLKIASKIFKEYYKKLNLNPKGNSSRLLCNLNSMIGDVERFKSQQEYYSEYLKKLNNQNITPSEWHPIHICADQNNIELLKYLLNHFKELDPNILNPNQYSSLQISTLNGHLLIVQCLIEKFKIDPNQLDTIGNSILSLSAQNGHLDVVRYLIEEIKVPSFMELKKDNSSEVKDVIFYSTMVRENAQDLKLDPNIKNSRGETPLLLSASYGHFEVVYYLLTKGKAQIKELDKVNNTILHRSAMNNQLEVVKYLIEEKEFPIDSQNQEKLNVLEVSAQYGSFEVFQELFTGAFFEAKTSICKSFCLSASQGRKQILDFLVEQGLKYTNFKYLNDCNPIVECASSGNLQMIKYYLSSWNQRWYNYDNAIYEAIKTEQLHVIKYLCETYKGILYSLQLEKSIDILLWQPNLKIISYLCEEESISQLPVASRILITLKTTLKQSLKHEFVRYCIERLPLLEIKGVDQQQKIFQSVKIATGARSLKIVRQLIENTGVDYLNYREIFNDYRFGHLQYKSLKHKTKDYFQSMYD